MPMPRRRAGLAIVVLSLSLSQLAFAVTLPDCATRCVTISATADCNIDKFACLCQDSTTEVQACISSICTGTPAFDSLKEYAGHTPSSTTPSANPTGSPTHSTSDSTTTPTGQPSNPGASSSSTGSTTANSSGGASGQTSTPDKTDSSLGSLVGAIVGGLVGGLLVVALAFFILRRRRRNVIDTDSLHAFRPARADNMSYMSDSKQGLMPGGILLDDLSSGHQQSRDSRSAYSPVSYHSPEGLPAGAAVPFNRGPGSVADSQGTLAARPVVFDTNELYPPRKGDPPRLPSVRGSPSVMSESVAGSSSQRGAPNEGGIPDNVTTILSATGAQGMAQNLTPQQLNAVSAMVNRGLPGTAVVDVIQQMLTENQDAPPGYDPPESGTMLRAMGMAPPASVSGGSGSGSRSGEQSSTNLPYRHGGSSAASP
ncbi:hypothetical protein BKA62DRAFT_708168 [Auriculariales sp. MPI-PUGE-AT-0066]|nr:hypothetical protein BKA62DRAFT_708168 [Auriculariales sp. MPI-PUGE-AT-0066]